MTWDGKLYASTITGDSTIFPPTDVTVVGGSGALGSIDDDSSYVRWADAGSGGVRAVFDAVPAGYTLGKDPLYGFYDYEVHARWRAESSTGSTSFTAGVYGTTESGTEAVSYGTSTPPDTWAEGFSSLLFDDPGSGYPGLDDVMAGAILHLWSSGTDALRVTAVWLQVFLEGAAPAGWQVGSVAW